jgi:hypothetical protein
MPLFDPLIFDTGAPTATAGEWSLSAIMDALAAATPVALTTKVYPHPVATVIPPAIIVGYPTDIDYDQVYGRASDKLMFPLWAVFGAVSDLAARDELSEALSGSAEIKGAIEASTTLRGLGCATRVTNAVPETVTIGGVQYISARFTVEVYS